jgi:hypothetical protein
VCLCLWHIKSSLLLLLVLLQWKRYSRNWCVIPGKEYSFGRIRVQLKNDDGSPVNPAVPNSECAG